MFFTPSCCPAVGSIFVFGRVNIETVGAEYCPLLTRKPVTNGNGHTKSKENFHQSLEEYSVGYGDDFFICDDFIPGRDSWVARLILHEESLGDVAGEGEIVVGLKITRFFYFLCIFVVVNSFILRYNQMCWEWYTTIEGRGILGYTTKSDCKKTDFLSESLLVIKMKDDNGSKHSAKLFWLKRPPFTRNQSTCVEKIWISKESPMNVWMLPSLGQRCGWYPLAPR